MVSQYHKVIALSGYLEYKVSIGEGIDWYYMSLTCEGCTAFIVSIHWRPSLRTPAFAVTRNLCSSKTSGTNTQKPEIAFKKGIKRYPSLNHTIKDKSK